MLGSPRPTPIDADAMQRAYAKVAYAKNGTEMCGICCVTGASGGMRWIVPGLGLVRDERRAGGRPGAAARPRDSAEATLLIRHRREG